MLQRHRRDPCPAPGEDFYGQDAQYVNNPRSYTKLDASGNDLPNSASSWTMVRDNVTGLIWEVKTDDGSVHDKDNTYCWDDAQSVFIAELNSTSFGGYSDWRLPTIKELTSITNLGRYNPSVNTDYFPYIPSSASLSLYWSSTTNIQNSSNVWVINFKIGFHYGNSVGEKSRTYYVRAVRGLQSGVSNDFINNGNGTITDNETGLIWEQQGSNSNMNWKDALN